MGIVTRRKDSIPNGNVEASDSSVNDKVRKINDELDNLVELPSFPTRKSEDREYREALGYILVKKMYENGDKYEGEWKNGNRDGRGHYVSLDGWNYKGEWKANKKHG